MTVFIVVVSDVVTGIYDDDRALTKYYIVYQDPYYSGKLDIEPIEANQLNRFVETVYSNVSNLEVVVLDKDSLDGVPDFSMVEAFPIYGIVNTLDTETKGA